MSTPRPICLVDDSDDYLVLLQALLNRQFPAYPILLFRSGQALLDQLPQLNKKPSLILLDRHMPGLDGHQTLLIIRAQSTYLRTPIVMMSADASDQEIQSCYGAGANSFLKKSYAGLPIPDAISLICRYWLELNQ
ncbi:MAG: response regulator [Pedobacter sp.]|nr:MAG: response regulator [Pedobacter sp.]